MQLTWVAAILVILASFCHANTSSSGTAPWQLETATVYYAGGQYVLQRGVEDKVNGIAWASYNKSVNASGWAVLNITTNPHAIPEQRWYAAGYIEGALTYDLIWDYYINLYVTDVGIYTPKELVPVVQFIEQNDRWILDQMKRDHSHEGEDAVVYWDQVKYIMTQFQGMLDACKKYSPPSQPISRLALLMTNLDGDMFDIIPAFVPAADPTLLGRKKPLPGHCTSFVRFTGDELFCAHNTWDVYQDALRIFKHYIFPPENDQVASSHMLFSSYPGTLSSEDDFYVLDSNLYVTETTNNNYNMTLYKLLSPKTVMSWVRTMVANRLAKNAKQWAEIYARYNSGTYNNQWVVVDHNLFTPGMKQLLPNTVWLVEQIPGYVESADVTDVVNRQGYWGGYNVPWFPYIFNVMMYPWAAQQWGAEYTQNCSRALIFKRDAGKVATLDDVKHIMQYNEWQTDPLSGGDPCNTIACRGDLDPTDPSTEGCYDAKATSHQLLMELQAWGISGPTHQDQPVFVWNAPGVPPGSHLGQPNAFDFAWTHFM